VRIRYADPPTFLQATQVIAGYQLQHSVTGGFEAFPTFSPSTFLSGSASTQLQQSPTFTFQPVSGEQFAKSFIRPLAPGDLLPLAMSGLPIDVLFRLGVQSTNGLSNAVALTDVGAAGSPDFFLLLRDLRALQVAGLLSIRLAQEPPPVSRPAPGGIEPPGTSGSSPASHVYLSVASSQDPALRSTAEEAKAFLGMRPETGQAEVVYGRTPEAGQIAVVTRSMLGVLSQLAIQIQVPPDDVTRHRTLATVGNIGPERRPIVIVYSGGKPPSDAFTSIRYRETFFWIAQDDFDSKLAFSVLQILLALARTQAAPGAIVTIPAG
jgi:hypothetical protein